ncbi:SAM-dependent methyltransferase [Kitasatospora sp. MAP12-15]|uniref:class I SAM-dependent methyltransferase n=1 Tax=unclassified Kitasatospora TaxID=2633591 RepID=UPI0024740F8A|nr:class I SAM-dependent methyltransferase [Kitasatospora sp. MAP12-44]MDH6108192.1 SAM-dependent methyltransferase [Kitasatospora sp. MAP12-44]
MTHDRELFSGTAHYYARYRSPYPADLLDGLTAPFGLGAGTDVLDLGCGSGQLGLPLSRTGCTVWAVDPDPDMIAEGVRTQADGEYGTVRWILGRGETVRSAGLPELRLCTMGASFHWMDRELVLKTLDEMIEPQGGVALVSGSASIFSKSGAVEGAWLDVTREVVTEFLGPQRRAGRGTYSHPKRGHEEVLLDSAFRRLETSRFTATRLLSVDEVVGQQLSTSYASPVQLGERMGEFRAELTRRLLELNPGDGFETVEHFDLIVARR